MSIIQFDLLIPSLSSSMDRIQVTLNVGLMKPRRGFTLVAGKEKLEVDKLNLELPLHFFLCKMRKRKGV